MFIDASFTNRRTTDSIVFPYYFSNRVENIALLLPIALLKDKLYLNHQISPSDSWHAEWSCVWEVPLHYVGNHTHHFPYLQLTYGHNNMFTCFNVYVQLKEICKTISSRTGLQRQWKNPKSRNNLLWKRKNTELREKYGKVVIFMLTNLCVIRLI